MSDFSRWKNIRYRLEYALVAAIAWFVPKLSRGIVARLGRGLGTLVFHVDRRGRAVALANVRVALGERPDARAIVQESYRQFVRSMLDMFWAPALSRENVRQYVQMEGLEHAFRLQEAGRGVVVIGTHRGGFEWSNFIPGYFGFNGMVVTEDFKNPLLDPLFRRIRSSSGHLMIGQEKSILRLLKQVKRGKNSGVLIDLNLRADQPAVVIETFCPPGGGPGSGLKMCVTMLHAVLVQRSDAALLPIETELRADGTCLVRFLPPLEPAPGATVLEIAQQCWDFFEPAFREHPERWMWAYKHFRYRPKGAIREYPFYANESGPFEKLQRAMGTPDPAT